MIRIAALAVAFVLAFASAPRAEIADGDRSAIQQIITGQIEAFRRDDGAAAFDFASPAIRNQFQTPEIFMSLVQRGYQPVYRPQSFAFGPLYESEFGPKQRVFVTGPDGQAYVAEYTLQQQPDGSWKINGCTILRDDSPSI